MREGELLGVALILAVSALIWAALRAAVAVLARRESSGGAEELDTWTAEYRRETTGGGNGKAGRVEIRSR